MKKLLILAIAAISWVAMAHNSSPCGSNESGGTRHFMQVSVDEINNNNSDGVMRVCCTLVGIPHTSSRIDSVTAVIGGRIYKAVDIDGVDFGRYFQWEDDGAIAVEVDVAHPMKLISNDSIKFHTVHGIYVAPLKRKK